jgi:hypothetical protein
LPKHHSNDFLRAIDARLSAIVEDNRTYQLADYKNACASKRMLELMEQLFNLETSPPDLETTERAREQYRKIETEFCDYLAERSDQLNKQAGTFLKDIIVAELQRCRSDFFAPGFAQLLTEEQYLAVQQLVRSAVDDLVQYAETVGKERYTGEDSRRAFKTATNTAQEMRLRLVRSMDSDQRREASNQWGRVNERLVIEVNAQLVESESREIRLAIDRTEQESKRMMEEGRPDSPQIKAEREAADARYLAQYGPDPQPRPRKPKPQPAVPRRSPRSVLFVLLGNAGVLTVVAAYFVIRNRRRKNLPHQSG